MTSVLAGARTAGLGVRVSPRGHSLWWLAAPALLGLSRLAPAEGAGLAFRLAAATACLLLPGALVARALRLGGVAPALVWSLAALFGAMTLMFALHTSLWAAPAVLGAVALAAASKVTTNETGISTLGPCTTTAPGSTPASREITATAPCQSGKA